MDPAPPGPPGRFPAPVPPARFSFGRCKALEPRSCKTKHRCTKAQRGGGIVSPPCSCASCWTNPAFGRKRKRCKGQTWWLEGPGAVLPLLPQVTHLLHYLLALPGTSPNIFSQPCYHAQPRLMNCPVTLCALCIIHHPDTVNVSKIFFPFWRRPHLLLEAFQLFLRERR